MDGAEGGSAENGPHPVQETRPQTPSSPSQRESGSLTRRTIIEIPDFDFTTMHNILCYIYAGKVNLPLASSSSHAYPNTADPFELYKAADMYGLGNLADSCLKHLQSSCTIKNICERLFDPVCDLYPALKSVYRSFLLENYDRIKRTPAWNEVFNIEELSGSESKYRTSLLAEISQHLTSKL